MNPTAKGNYSCKDHHQDKTLIQDDNHNQDVALNLVKDKLESFQITVMQDVQKKMDIMVEDIIQEIRLYEMKTIEFKDFAKEQYNQIWKNRKPKTHVINDDEASSSSSSSSASKSRQLLFRKFPEKIFIPRESYLTALLEISHIRSIYNFFLIFVLFTFLHNAVYGYYIENSFNIGLETIRHGFGNLHLAIFVWLILHVPVFLLFYAFQLWTIVRQTFKSYEFIQCMWSYCCIIMFVSFLLIFGYVGFTSCLKLNLHFISSGCLLAETIRLIMKMHGFIRTNVGKHLTFKKLELLKNTVTTSTKNHQTTLIMPLFSNYLYFLFAPTLIYRDSYPRTKQIRWRFAISRLMEMFGVMLIVSAIHEHYMRPYYLNYGSIEQSKGNLIVTVFGSMMPGLVVFLAIFYCVLHAWLNFTSEILRFADRMFYRDWWTVGNYDTYYRYWNTIVHDYLYEYIYKDVYLYVFNGSRILSGFTVFLISALIHEIMMSFSLHFIYPVMFVFFIGVGGFLILITRCLTTHTIGNMIILAGAGIGNGVMMSLYYMEYYARRNCPIDNSEWQDSFKWVSWRCNGFKL